MSCCVPYQFPFTNVAFSSIGYNADMKSKLGQVPKIEVYYLDPTTGDFYTLNGVPSVQINFDGATINIDHGGIATGIVKLS